MNIYKNAKKALVVCSIIIAVSGCAHTNKAVYINSTPSIYVIKSDESNFLYQLDTVTHVSSEKVHISNAHAQIKGDNLVVSGTLKSRSRKYLQGHVDIAMYSSDGRLLKKTSTRVYTRPRRRRRSRQASFKRIIKNVQTKDYTIFLAYHNSTYSPDNNVICENNMAMPNTQKE